MRVRPIQAVLAAVCCAIALPVCAGSFEVNPVRLNLSASARTSSLTVKNTGTDTVVVQTNVVAWSQQQGKDVYSPTNDILVTPPIVTIAPGAEQIVRAGLRRAPDPTSELAYRVYLQEAPPPPKPGFQGLQVALRVGLPLFVEPVHGPARAALSWTLLHRGNTLRLELHNEGNGHIQIGEVQLFPTGSNKPIATQSTLAYVLPGQSRSWEFKIEADQATAIGKRLRLKAATDMGSVETELAFTTP